MIRRLEALIGRDIARGTLVGSLFMVLRVFLQAVYLVLAARALSAAGYGQFSAVVSLVAIVSPLAGLGSSMVMARDVSREPARFSSSWTTTTRLTLLSGLVFAALLVPFSVAVLPGVNLVLVAAVVGAETLAAPLIVAAAFAFQAHGRFTAAHTVSVLLYAGRIGAAGFVFFWLAEPTPTAFAVAHLAATAAGALTALAMVQRQLRPRRDLHARASWREGMPYAASGVIGLVNSEVDKPLLLRFAGAEAAGLYGAAFRLASAVTAPVGALVVAAAPTFFREAEVPPTRALRVLAVAIGYSVVAAIGLAAMAWLAPLLLGPTFAPSAPLLQWLAPWLVFNAARQIGCAALTTRGHQGARLAFEGLAAAASAALNIVLIPELGAFGAVGAVTLTDAMVAVSAWWFILGRRYRKAETV